MVHSLFSCKRYFNTKLEGRDNMGKIERKIVSFVILVVMLVQTVYSISLPATAQAEETTATTSIFTDYLPTINEVIDTNGFKHPSVGLTKELLERVRTNVRAGVDPWSYYFNAMLAVSPDASKTIGSNNSSDGKTPSADYFDSQSIEARFIADAIKAYSQAMMYYITGDEVYRANGMMIIRIWEKMDPAKCKYYTDACIHAAIPLYRMTMAAEILRYTSCQTEALAWTEKDTTDFTNHLIVPVTETFLHDQNHFMNQHNYPVLGAMAGYIFTGNRERYNEDVEWFTVNATAKDQGFNGSLKQLFRWVTEEQEPGIKVGEGTPIAEPHVQHMEMGRDQAHGGGDITNAAMITRLLLSQGTMLDPVTGTPSTAANAVGPMEFLNDRMLAAADFFWHFMLGYDSVWVPQAFGITGGDPNNGGMGGYIRDTYNYLSTGYYGRFATANFWDFYSYYTYVRQEDVSKIAPYYYEAFTKKLTPDSGSWHNTDAGNDFWLYLPAEAAADADKFIPQNKSTSTIYEVEERYTNLTKLDMNKPAVKDNNNPNAVKETNNIDTTAVTSMTEGATSFIRLNAREAGTRIAVLSSMFYDNTTYELRIRTNGVATLVTMGQTVSLPNTYGEWKYIPVTGVVNDFDEIIVKGAPGVTVDIDHINKAILTPPVFKAGSSDLKIYTYVGASVNVDFSATDAGSTDVVAYELQRNPVGTSINTSTGEFSWQPTEGGNYDLLVTATDGTIIASKKVTIIVGSDRTSAVQAITASYDPEQIYESATLQYYQGVYNNTMSSIDTASDTDFDQQLQLLRAATEGLKLTTPLLALDGSLRWSSVAAWSSWGSFASIMDDGNNLSGGSLALTLGSAPDTLHHIIDFGPDYKVSATKFGFQSNIFADRLANSTVYGSNDKVNWTRLTPGVTPFTQAYSTLEVDPAYQNEKYRYIKLQMMKPLPDVIHGTPDKFLELTEFRIYGTRHEIGNTLESISMSSDQGVNGKVSIGDSIKLTIKAKEPIQNVTAKIQGIAATVTTTDNINWTAVVTTTGDVKTGDVAFTLDYQKNDGTNGDTTYQTTDNSKLFLVDGSKFINVAMLATVTASDRQWPGNGLSMEQVGYLLFDGNPATYGDLNSTNAYYTVDFGAGAAIKLNEVVLMPREAAPARMIGMVVQGSNDNVNWTDLTKSVQSSQAKAWTDLRDGQIINQEAYRYLRLYNSNSWSGNVAEVEFYGNYVSTAANLAAKITSIASPSNDATSIVMPRVPAGYTVAIKSTTPEGLIGADGVLYKPTYDTLVNVVFTVTNTADGTTADTVSCETLVPGLTLAPKIDVTNVATVTASDRQWVQSGTPLTKEQIGYYLFDGNLSTAGDLNTGVGSYYIVDFGAGSSVKLNEIKLMPRTGNITRANGVIILGSNDTVNWTTLTNPVIGAQTDTWIDIRADKILDRNYYRYYKIYNPGTWFGNLTEVEFYGDYTFDLEAKVIVPDSYTKGSYYLYQKEVDRIRKELSQPGADKTVLLMQLTAAQAQLVTKGTLIADRITVTPSMVKASSSQWASSGSTGTPEQNGWRAFDGDINTATDATSNPSWIRVDLGADNEQSIGSVKFYPRSGNIARMNGAILQGSNDGSNFVNLYTISGISQLNWYTASITDNTAYRYLRYYSPNGLANISELAFYQKANDKTLVNVLLAEAAAIDSNLYTEASVGNLQETLTAAQVVNANANATQAELDAAADQLLASISNLRFKAKLTMNPAEPDGLNGWYTTPVTLNLESAGFVKYSFDGDTWETYTNPLLLNKDGEYTIRYRTLDQMGNVLAEYSTSVKVDVTAPMDATFSADTTALTNSNVTIAIGYPEDAVVKEYKLNDSDPWTEYTVPVVISDNTMIYARGKDEAGNTSKISSYLVSNISKTPDVLTRDLISIINQLNLTTEFNTSLVAMLDQAGQSILNGDKDSSVQYLNQFIQQVKAQQDSLMNTENTAILITRAEDIILSINSESVMGKPGTPVLSDDSGWENGIKDGSYNITMNLWWGTNGDSLKLYENGVLIATQGLSDQTPKAQEAILPMEGKSNGVYTYYCELTNKYGTTTSNMITVAVTQASPEKPILSNDNWDGDGNYTVAMNMWWGTNGSTCNLYENGVLIDTQELADNTPSAQSANFIIEGRAVGSYVYYCELINQAGTTTSDEITVTVSK